MVKEIPLTHGKVALVDDEDYDYLMQWKWYAAETKWGFKAVRRKPSIFMHRLILKAPAGKEVDHKNHNTLDNRRCNLRFCTRSQNKANSLKTMIKTTSVYKGVCWDKNGKRRKRWEAMIRVNGRTKYLGRFEKEIDAARAYNIAAVETWHEFALLNEILE